MADLLITYLQQLSEKLRPIQRPSTLDFTRDKVALIVEPRPHYLLEAVVRNITFHLPDWNLQVVTSEKTAEFLKEKLPGWNYRLNLLPVDNLRSSSYNTLLKSPEFWQETGPEEHVLIFQTDSMILNQYDDNRIEDYFDYPYVGARFAINDAGDYVKTPGGKVMNGGFSLRRRSAMIRIATEITRGRISSFRHSNQTNIIDMKNTAEDVFFCHGAEIMGYKLPEPEIIDRFAIEDLWNSDNGKNVIGIHGWQYGFFNKHVDKLLSMAYPLDAITSE